MKQAKHSGKRDEIYRVIASTKSHPSAEWVYSVLKPKIPDLSLATVYRNIALFREKGDIIGVATVNGQDRFDADTSPHAHFICNDCNAVIDIEGLPYSDDFIRIIEVKYDISVVSNSLLFYGRCKSCSIKNRN